MKRAGKIIVAGAILAAVLLAGTAAAQEGSIKFSRNGDAVTISGSTNLAAGDRLLVNVVSAAFTPTGKGSGGGFAGAAGTAVVQQGTPLNTYSFDVDVSTFPPGEYLVTVESVETGFRDSAQFVLPWTPVPTQPPAVPTPETATTSPPPPSTTQTIPAPIESPTQVPVSGIAPVAAVVLAACILLSRR
jgi:hypothetical protein